MNPHEVIQKINSAIVNDNLEDAKKALEEFTTDFALFVIEQGQTLQSLNDIYRMFTNQSSKK